MINDFFCEATKDSTAVLVFVRFISSLNFERDAAKTINCK